MGPRSPPELEEGLTLLDRYTILDRVGGGGMADIYRAHDSRLDRIVCVKLLRNIIEGSGSASGGVVYQATYTHFLQEARSLSRLAHPNTLRIYDFGFLQIGDEDAPGHMGPRPFQISEFLDGGNLDTHVRTHGALKPYETLAILDRMAGAAAEAHGAGIIHRDIKPSNILFSRVGDALMPKLADFGIARGVRKATPEGEEVTSNDALSVPLFSPRWAAPEQLSSGEEGPYTDVYALALVVAFMLAGRGLFEVSKIDRTYPERVQGDTFVRDRLSQGLFAPEVARVLMDALRANPRSRLQSPFALYQALARTFGSPTGALPGVVTHSGEVSTGVHTVPAAPDSGIVRAAFRQQAPAAAIEPPEQWLRVGGRDVRLVETHEKLDLGAPASDGTEVRVRLTLLPGRGPQVRVNIKGLNCFVARTGAGASPAIVVDNDGTAELLSSKRALLARLAWSFGGVRGAARVFPIAGGELVVPFPQGEHALAVEFAENREVIVVCRRE